MSRGWFRSVCGRALPIAALLISSAAWQAAPASATAVNSAGYAWGDFDDDGYGDLAFGAPGESIGTRAGAGAVHVMYGGPVGLGPSGSQLWTQDTRGVPGGPERGDGFGSALAAGDFDADGTDDLAIGTPRESLDGAEQAGTVTVLFGRRTTGLSAVRAQLLRQGGSGIDGTAETGDVFGSSLASGLFNGAGAADLAVGVPGESIGGRRNVGAVQILNGASPGGLSGAQGETIHQGLSEIAGEPEDGDRLGQTLSVGNYDGDAYEDLAIGVPSEDIRGLADAGAVTVVYGSISGPDTSKSHFMSQDHIFLERETASGDRFGAALASGNFNLGEDRPNSYDDLAIGVPGDLSNNSGSVNIVHGSTEGFVEVAEIWFQGKAGDDGAVAGTPESGDGFGSALAANDFNRDARADLAIGVPGEDQPATNEGAVVLLYGSPSGVEPGFGPSHVWTQDSGGIGGVGERDDGFGSALTSSDYDRDGFADLAIGARGEDIGSKRNAGAVWTIRGGSGRMTSSGSDVWSQATKGIRGTPEDGDRVGTSGG